MNKFKTTAQLWFYNFMHVQLFLSLISLPLLVAWGLPFSLMTVGGNLLFTPVLTLFLLVCAGIFFCELFHIPNKWLIYVLEKISALWMRTLEYGSTSWLYGIDQWGLLICIFSSFTACIILHHKQWGKERKSWIFFSLLLILPFLYQKIRSFFPQKFLITCIKKNALITSQKGTLSLIDYGALGEKKSASTWIQYTLLPQALKKGGSITFDLISCPYAQLTTLEALLALCNHAPIKKIILTHPRRQSNHYKHCYKELELFARTHGIILHANK
jgi:hypothetical protein